MVKVCFAITGLLILAVIILLIVDIVKYKKDYLKIISAVLCGVALIMLIIINNITVPSVDVFMSQFTGVQTIPENSLGDDTETTSLTTESEESTQQ